MKSIVMSASNDKHLDRIELAETCVPPDSPQPLQNSLRLLARWRISASRKGAPVADSGRSAEGQIVLDVGPDAEVVSKPEASEMPVQQAFQRGDRR